ncbi:hypothetical protein [Halopelagius longus]|nr:hypothetical protein [Halopelagius longus]
MKRSAPGTTAEAYDRRITARSLVVSYLVAAAIPLALWAASEPLPTVAAAVTVAATAAVAVTAGRRLRRRESARRRHLCVPRTSVCVEV